MKKMILIGSVFVALAVAGVHFLISKKDQLPVLSEEPAEEAAKTISAPEKFEYRGQALEFLGDPAVLSRYPRQFVDGHRAKLTNLIALMEKNWHKTEYWIDIGIIKKTFDNFIGARDAWEYAKVLNPKSALTHQNLGNLYGAYLGNLIEAEKNFLKAVELDPNFARTHLGLAEFYRDFYKEKSHLVDNVLLKGLEYIPDDLTLVGNLAVYYKAIGDKAKAIKYFEKLLQLPGLTGTEQQSIEEEIRKLSESQ